MISQPPGIYQLDHTLHARAPVRIMLEHLGRDDGVKHPPRLILVHQADHVDARPWPPIETHVLRAP